MRRAEIIARAKISGVLLLFIMGMIGVQAADAGSSGWHIVAPQKTQKVGKSLPELPPLAVVESRDNTGKTWGVVGSLGGAMAVARSDFKVCFERQGWELDKVIPMGKGKQILLLWRRGDSSIILMLREAGPSETDFAVGLNDNSGAAHSDVPGLPREASPSPGQKLIRK